MLKPVSIWMSVLTCSAYCPPDNQARQLALFLYETLQHILNPEACPFLPFLRGKVFESANMNFPFGKPVIKSHF